MAESLLRATGYPHRPPVPCHASTCLYPTLPTWELQDARGAALGPRSLWAVLAQGREGPAGTPGSEQPRGAARWSSEHQLPGQQQWRVQAQGWVPLSQLVLTLQSPNQHLAPSLPLPRCSLGSEAVPAPQAAPGPAGAGTRAQGMTQKPMGPQPSLRPQTRGDQQLLRGCGHVSGTHGTCAPHNVLGTSHTWDTAHTRMSES